MRDPLAVVRAMLAMLRVIQERDAKIARLEQDNAAARSQVEMLEERLAQWEAAADVIGPVGGPM